MVKVIKEVPDSEVVEKSGSDSGFGFFAGILLLIIVVIMLFYYGIPFLRGTTTSPQIQVPNKIDVNLNQ